MQTKTIILDAGHGIGTPGKRSPLWDNGLQLFEWEFNRDIVSRIAEELTRLGIPNVILVPEVYDLSLSNRVRRANEIRNSVLISVHANAFEDGRAKGWGAYTSKGETKSDEYAKLFYEEFAKEFPNRKARTDFSDGDIDKEANFYMLKNTNMPAVLTESFFMTNEDECKNILLTEEGRSKIAKLHIEAIKRIS